jgi:hypothetical protein
LTNFFLTQLSLDSQGHLTRITDTVVDYGGLTDMAITPDGRSLYLVSSQGFLVRLDISPTGPTSFTRIPVAQRMLGKMVITPDGATAYVTLASEPCLTSLVPSASCGVAGAIAEVDLVHQKSSTFGIARPTGNRPNPIDLAIATSPSGSSALWVADGGNAEVIEVPLPVPPNFTPTKVAFLDSLLTAVAATPDGGRIEVTTRRGVIGVDTATAALTCDADCPGGNGPIAITPDQRPQASFTAAPGVAGKATSFDASSSSVAFGGVSTYAWDFGDGATQATTGAATSHTYAKAGTYRVALVETDGAGASEPTSPPSTIFTGHTMTRRGGPPARVTHDVTIPSGPGPTAPAPPGTSPLHPAPPTAVTPQSATPTITVVPVLGPPGTVVAVSGSGFPANTAVPLVWKPGIGTGTAFTDGTGSFHVQMLVLPKDELGPRLLQAQPAGSGPSAPFLVVPISVEPAGGNVQLLFRR